jgi:hypothetical protein
MMIGPAPVTLAARQPARAVLGIVIDREASAAINADKCSGNRHFGTQVGVPRPNRQPADSNEDDLQSADRLARQLKSEMWTAIADLNPMLSASETRHLFSGASRTSNSTPHFGRFS